MTKIINLFGGPGTGKSTSAAYIYYRLKDLGKNVELVREYVKDWAWDNRKIGEFDQFYFMGKQMRRESMLYGKVDYIVTDSPVIMNSLYANKYCDIVVADAVEASVLAYLSLANKQGHKHINFLLNRSKPYEPSGRYQTETEAKAIDKEVKETINVLQFKAIWAKSDFDITFDFLDTTKDALDKMLENFK